MPNVLVVDRDKLELGALEAMLASAHEVVALRKTRLGLRSIVESEPDLIIAKLEKRGGPAVDVLQFLKDSRRRIPVIVLVPLEAEERKSAAVKLFAKLFVRSPVRHRDLFAAIEAALAAKSEKAEEPPPLTPVEERGNLTQLCTALNARVTCAIGQNQVYVQSVLKGSRSRTKPRVALKCKVRPMFGFSQDVYFVHIQRVCSDHNESSCEALKLYQEKGAR